MSQKTITSSDNDNSNKVGDTSSHVENSEESMRQKREEERVCLKQTYDFLKILAKKLKRNQAIVNTSMVFFLKYTRIYSFTNINKFLVASACFLLGAKCRDEPVPIEYLVEWYIYFETNFSRSSRSTTNRCNLWYWSQWYYERQR